MLLLVEVSDGSGLAQAAAAELPYNPVSHQIFLAYYH